MAGTATVYTETAVLGHSLGFASMPMPAAVFVGLTSSAPSASVPGSEVVGGGYTRQPTTFAIATGGPTVQAANAATIAWASATAAWGTIGWSEIWDALSGGTRLYWGQLVDPTDGVTPITRSVQVGDVVRLQAGALLVVAV